MKAALPLLSLLASPVHAAPEWTVRLIDTRENPVGRPDKDWSNPRRRITVKDLREAAITGFLYNEMLCEVKDKAGKCIRMNPAITPDAYAKARNQINATDYQWVVGKRSWTFPEVPIGRPDLYLQITYFDDAVAQ